VRSSRQKFTCGVPRWAEQAAVKTMYDTYRAQLYDTYRAKMLRYQRWLRRRYQSG
jgi:hypothetical protein